MYFSIPYQNLSLHPFKPSKLFQELNTSKGRIVIQTINYKIIP